MTPAQLLAVGNAAVARAQAEHDGQDGTSLITRLGRDALARLAEARGGRSDMQIIQQAGAEAMRRSREMAGGMAGNEKIRRAAGHGADISGTDMLKAMELPTGDPDGMLADLTKALTAPRPDMDALARMIRTSPLTDEQRARRQTARVQEAEQARAARLAPERPILATEWDGAPSATGAREFRRCLQRDLQRGAVAPDRRAIARHATRWWGLTEGEACGLMDYLGVVHGHELDRRARAVGQ